MCSVRLGEGESCNSRVGSSAVGGIWGVLFYVRVVFFVANRKVLWEVSDLLNVDVGEML